MRTALLACLMVCVIGLAACGSADTGVKRGYIAISCDGKLVAHADLSQPPAPAPASISFGTSHWFGGNYNGLFTFNASDGALRWCTRFSLNKVFNCRAPVACGGPLSADVGTPLIAGDVVYVCVTGGPIGLTYAFNASDGALRWSRETGCQESAQPFPDGAQPILADGVLYSGPYGLSPQDGGIHWRLPKSVAQASIGAVAGGVAYVFAGRTLSAVRLADGAVTWTATLAAPIGDRPVLSGDHLYVGDSSSAVTHGLPVTYALDLQTGAVRWTAPTGGVAGSAAVEANGTVYIGTQDGLNALDVATGRSAGGWRWPIRASPRARRSSRMGLSASWALAPTR